MSNIHDYSKWIAAWCWCAVCATALCGCGDWTEDRSVEIETSETNTGKLPGYGEYLTRLRAYKKTDHLITMGWFDNSRKEPVSQGDLLSVVPDSVDIISLLCPDDLTPREREQMNVLQTERGTKVIYTIDCVGFEAGFNRAKSEAEEAGIPFERNFFEELGGFMDDRLALLDRYPYDGLSVHYEGYWSEFVTPEEQSYLEQTQDIIFGRIVEAADKPRNRERLFVFEGTPQYVVRQYYWPVFDYIVIRTHDKTSIGDVQYKVNTSIRNGVPDEKIIVTAIPACPYESDESRGYFIQDGVEVSAIEVVAEWVTVPTPAYVKAGMGIYLINHDYYWPGGGDYRHVRNAINTMNPSPAK